MKFPLKPTEKKYLAKHDGGLKEFGISVSGDELELNLGVLQVKANECSSFGRQKKSVVSFLGKLDREEELGIGDLIKLIALTHKLNKKAKSSLTKKYQSMGLNRKLMQAVNSTFDASDKYLVEASKFIKANKGALSGGTFETASTRFSLSSGQVAAIALGLAFSLAGKSMPLGGLVPIALVGMADNGKEKQKRKNKARDSKLKDIMTLVTIFLINYFFVAIWIILVSLVPAAVEARVELNSLFLLFMSIGCIQVYLVKSSIEGYRDIKQYATDLILARDKYEKEVEELKKQLEAAQKEEE